MRTLVFALSFCSLFVVATGLSADEVQIGRPLDPPFPAASIPPSSSANGIAVVIPLHMPDTLLVSKQGEYAVEPNSKVRITLAVDPKRFPSVLLRSSKGEEKEVRVGSVTKTRSIESSQTSMAEIEFGIVDSDVTLEVNDPESPFADLYEFEVRRPEERDATTRGEVEFLSEPGKYSLRVGTIVRVQCESVRVLPSDGLGSGKLKTVAERVIRTREAGGEQKLVTEFEFRALEAGSAEIRLFALETPAEPKMSVYSLQILP